MVVRQPKRTQAMIAASEAKRPDRSEWRPAPVPNTKDLAVLPRAAKRCTACPLYKNATQTVFGEGPDDAKIVLVGEQPGDQEDREGRPFVGPAGKLLDRALADAGIDRTDCYVTNAVKHFKWEPRGKRRIHQTPTARDVAACRPWLEAEIKIIQPRVLVLLGATAARAVCGPTARVMRDRGVVRSSPRAERILITVHPSALLRAPDEATAKREYRAFVADLRVAAAAAA
jgi:DNA polymerase